MLNLMKYEFLRRKRLLTTILLIFAFLEAGVWLGMKLEGNWYIMSVAFVMLLFVGGIAFPFIDAVVNYYSDFKNKNGYMLFLTPNNGYKIIGSKVLFLIAEMIAVFAIVACALRFDFHLLQTSYPDVVNPIIAEMADSLKLALNLDKITFWTASPLLALGLVQYLTNAMIALFAITIAKTLLSNKDFNWLLALVFYFALYSLVQIVNTGALAAFGFVGDIIRLTETNGDTLPNIMKYFMVGLGTYAIWLTASFTVSGALITKRTDL